MLKIHNVRFFEDYKILWFTYLKYFRVRGASISEAVRGAARGAVLRAAVPGWKVSRLMVRLAISLGE